jgi:hypothetical protein
MRPDGAVVKASNAGDRDDEEDYDDDDIEEDDESSTDRWVLRSGTPGSFCLACRGPFGPLAPVVSMKGDHRRLLCFPCPIPDPGISQFR